MKKKELNASDIKFEKACCRNCSFFTKRPDMKNVKYCIKRNFAILNDGECCTKYIRKIRAK